MAGKPRAVLGGTFDKFHRGHRSFLRAALEGSDKLLICITSDGYALATKGHPIEPYGVRAENVREFVKRMRCGDRVEIVQIDNPYGPAIEERELDAIFVTAENESRGEEINVLRGERGLPPLKVIEVPLELGEDGRPISATRIREGLIDPEGREPRDIRT
jgi:pantetheine-phosphate adenylyltransferase